MSIFRRTQRLDGFQSEADSHKQSDLDHHLLHFFLPSNRHTDRAYYYFYTVKKRKVDPHCPWIKAVWPTSKISHNFEDKKSTQNVSTYSKRSKRGEEQFYKPATHLNAHISENDKEYLIKMLKKVNQLTVNFKPDALDWQGWPLTWRCRLTINSKQTAKSYRFKLIKLFSA